MKIYLDVGILMSHCITVNYVQKEGEPTFVISIRLIEIF